MNDIVKQTPQNNLPAMNEGDLIVVLQASLYPGADVQSVRMVIDYCRASGLDPMQKPVHIVPMWDGKQGKMRDVIMPGVGLYRIQASRTGQFAGMTETEFGPMITLNLGGTDITVPEFARVTAKRVLDSGVVAEFTAIEYWIENYAVKGGKEKSIAPNAMWMKRPRGQIAKCAQAQALRLAFPELGAQSTAEEMEGKQYGQEEIDITPTTQDAPPPEELVNEATIAAEQGVKAYEVFWKATGADNRKLLKSLHSNLKALAVEADTVPYSAHATDDFDKGLDTGNE